MVTRYSGHLHLSFWNEAKRFAGSIKHAPGNLTAGNGQKLAWKRLLDLQLRKYPTGAISVDAKWH